MSNDNMSYRDRDKLAGGTSNVWSDAANFDQARDIFGTGTDGVGTEDTQPDTYSTASPVYSQSDLAS